MRLLKICCIGIIIIGVASLSYAQNDIDDRGQETANHNYFVAGQTKYLSNLLGLVEGAHMINSPHNPGGGGTIGNIAKGRYDYAKGDVTYVLEHFVNHPKALQLMSMIALATHQYAWAVEKFEYALKWYPNYALTHAQYGSFLVEMGNVPAGIEKLETAVKMDPKLLAGWVWLNRAYNKQGNAESARQAGEKAMALGYKGQLPDK